MRGKDVHEAPKLPACIRRKRWDFRNIPGIFADRVLKLGILSFSMLLLGIFMGIQMQSPGYAFWSVILSLIVFVQAVLLLRTAKNGNYEVVEGTILLITGKHPVGRFRKVRIGCLNGSETVLLLDKSIPVEMGSHYRFYFNSRQHALSGIKTVDAALSTGSFYGFEKIDRKGGDGKM